MAKTIVRLAQEQGAPGASRGPLQVKISQRALGEIVGGSRESVNKHLQDWKRAGIIVIEKGTIVIRDVASLSARK
jgi:CRP-like cAMP-binding protein